MTPILVRSPSLVRPTGPTVFLGGSIEMGTAEMWQPRVAQRFIDAGVSVLDPRRDAWDASLNQDPSQGSVFETQVSWELAGMERADLVFFRICEDTASIVSMLEIGLNVGRKPVVIQVDDGYQRRGNIIVTAGRYRIPCFRSEDDAVSEAIRIIKWL